MKISDEAVIKLGAILKEKRKNLDLTLEQVKIKIENMGQQVSRSDIQRLENGERKIPNAILIKNLCKIYNLDVIELFKKIGYLDSDTNANNLKKSQFSPSVIYENNEMKKIKVFGSIAAGIGYPCEAVEYIEEISLPLKNAENIFAVRVSGDSMVPEIKDGSLILIEEGTEVFDKEIGAFYLNGDYLVKRKVRNGKGELFLMSENQVYLPIVVKEYDDFKELGKVVGILNWC